MLKNLFKYEFKSTAKIMLILYAILIVTTAVGSVVLYSLDLDQAGESKLASILSVSAIVLYILAIFAVLIVMYVYLCVHFYRTMYSAQMLCDDSRAHKVQNDNDEDRKSVV